MPSTVIFAINNEGRIYALPTNSSTWREFLYLGLEFKKISAVNHFMWAIGGDRQVYVHVHGIDTGIRVREEVYENERWNPISGFTAKLLPTDRFHFSNVDGTVNREIDKIRCPSMAWQWEGEWELELTLEGQPLDHDGWTYAVDFPATYHPEKQWKSCVRRRKWFRFRRYSALNSWCAIAPLHKDATEEPFIDVAIGGTNIPGAEDGMLAVWAITSNGRVVFRTGVSHSSPEGLRWTLVKAQTGCEASQISVGTTGLVWCSLYNGRAMVRSGCTKDNLMGDNWIEVKPPENGLKITCVSVGRNSVWCVTNDNHVYWRRGVKGDIAGVNEDAAIGNAWVEMVGNISQVSVTSNDQVFAIGAEDRALYFRSGVTSSDPTGKKWRQIQCPMQMSRTSSINSLGSRRSGSESPNSKHKSMGNLLKERNDESPKPALPDFDETSHSAPNQNSKYKPELWKKPYQSPPSGGRIDEEKDNYMVPNSAPLEHVISSERVIGRSVSPVRSVGSVVATEANPDSDSIVFEGEFSRDSGIFGEDDVVDHIGGSTWTIDSNAWTVVTSGAVQIDINQLPNWFNDTFGVTTAEEFKQPWRLSMLEKLRNVNNGIRTAFGEYEKAIEMNSWVKSGEAKVSKPGKPFEDCLLELEWVDTQGASGSGTLTVLSSDGVTIKLQFSLSEIMCVASCSEASTPRIVIHAPRLPNGTSPVRFQFSAESEQEDWLSHLTSVCCQINNLSGKPSENSIWATSVLGDVFTFDPTTLNTNQYNDEKKQFSQEIELSATETPYTVSLYNGMTKGTELEVIGYVCPDADQVRFDLLTYPSKKGERPDIALHINPRFNENTLVFNTKEKSEWLDEVRDTMLTFAPGAEFKLTIKTLPNGFEVTVDNVVYPIYHYRTNPNGVVSFFSSGRVKIFKIRYHSPSVIMCPTDLFWRQMGGHLKKVETCKAGVTWGIANDNTPYYYTGGWGGQFLKGLESSTTGIHSLTDAQNYYIYENQRWNPISGFSSTGLPTDRHCWSDVTGKHKRSKDHVKVPSTHWHWISDWMVDFHTPGGVDRDGWQYAVDFPASYHGKKNFTDYVRRRRWYRKCQLSTTGPWELDGSTSHRKPQ
ncbi:tectonin beta-propeller repeat-containing protein isoform X2 [Culicoides brevitarsis]|uniref:tectonin beta-propeller repeat-containing protein isoform X2 n=1 Tax=Culicoides brevitarsis TaxID=469753 RepID=UPI00307B30B5